MVSRIEGSAQELCEGDGALQKNEVGTGCVTDLHKFQSKEALKNVIIALWFTNVMQAIRKEKKTIDISRE